MKLLSVGLARALWFMDLNETNPGGKDIFTHLVPALIDQYKFRSWPKVGDEFKDGMKFTGGEFAKGDGTVLAVNTTIYTDGISADTFSSTRDSEEFLREALNDLPNLGFAFDEEMIRRKGYLSQITVRCSSRLRAINARLADFAKSISSATGGIAYDVAAVEFWPDQSLVNKPANFSFQRKSGDPFSEDRYWSQAGVPTDAHLKLIEELETILSETQRT